MSIPMVQLGFLDLDPMKTNTTCHWLYNQILALEVGGRESNMVNLHVGTSDAHRPFQMPPASPHPPPSSSTTTSLIV